MVRKNKTTLSKIFSLLAAVILCFTVFSVPVSAEDGEGNPKQNNMNIKLMYLENADDEESEPDTVVPIFEDGRWNRMHSDPAVFNRNTVLTPEQKEYAITKCEEVASQFKSSKVSDLEKYYTLAIWLNKNVSYDWDFWPGGYDLAYYSHQWDAYGVLEGKKSICAGIAVTYANLCHAADLPCKFIRMKPYYLDHTINYIPDINGHAYYIDITENMFFMSDKANPWHPMDTDFSHITKIPNDSSFNYSVAGSLLTPNIKDYYDTPFKKWFNEYALHKNTKKKFKTKYVEKGSGNGKFHAAYKNYPKQFSDTEKPGIWFLEDFYQDPKSIETKILSKEFDEQLLNITGVKGSYDCDTAEELEAAVTGDIAIKYFPSSENGEVVAKAASLTKDTDYTVTCDTFDASTGEAKLTIKGAGEYSGEYQIPVKLHSAAVTKAPVSILRLVYTGKTQTLVEPGEAENGTILYAVRQFDESKAYPAIFDDQAASDPKNAPDPGLFSDKIPTATDAGHYEIWYMIEGDESHSDVQPQRVGVSNIAPLESKILANDITMKEGETIPIAPVLDTGLEGEFGFMGYDDNITVSDDGVVKGIAAGKTQIIITCKLIHRSPNYADPEEFLINVKVKANPYCIDNAKVKLSKTKFTYNGKVHKPSIKKIKGKKLKANTNYTATWSNASSKNAGTYTVTIEGKGKYIGTTKATYQIVKAANPMKLKGKKAKVKRREIKENAVTIDRAKVIKVTKARGEQTYKLVTAKKGKKSFKKYFEIDHKTGDVTVKKGLKKGKYKVNVKVKAAGNANYKASAWKKVTFKVKVK